VALASGAAARGHARFTVAGVDVFCLQKQGNTIPILAAGRVPAELALVEQYELIRGQYRNLLFREQLVRNLLRERPWHEGFGRLFSLHDAGMFIGSGARGFPDCSRRRLRADFALQGGIDD
jgi:CRISPR-associated protein Cmx8